MTDLQGKVALISGGAKGQGEAHARLLAEMGARVVLGDILVDRLPGVCDDIAGEAVWTKLDVTSEDDWASIVQLAESEFGRLDILVNNAGIFEAAPVDEATLDHYRRVISINQEGVFLGMRAAVPLMAGSGGGSIVNIASVNAEWPDEDQVAYAASKAAVVAMTKVAAMELGSRGIRANVILPGGINTDMAANSAVEQAKFYGRLALGRLGEPIEVAHLVAFLASDDSSYVTGSSFVIDGGWGTGRYRAEFSI